MNLPSPSTASMHSANWSGFKLWPRFFITVPRIDVGISPFLSRSYMLNASRISAIWSSVNWNSCSSSAWKNFPFKFNYDIIRALTMINCIYTLFCCWVIEEKNERLSWYLWMLFYGRSLQTDREETGKGEENGEKRELGGTTMFVSYK